MSVFKMKDSRKMSAGFDQVPNDLIRGMREVSDPAFRVYMYLHSLGQEFSPTQKVVAKALGKTEVTIQRAYKELADNGYLRLERNGKRYIYILRENPRNVDAN